MLAPGAYLVVPVQHQPVSVSSQTPQPFPALQLGATRTERTAQSSVPAVPPAETQKPEPQSFLLRLLRALGAVHI
jgi:hypothetical protein